ncbi:PPE family protein [[Mycobacterium] nativiensis]|uniref:PPE family protein n=1 Tax=[Mycobacterium] nativiensis TaxID=2855503 RepID=A0ABU5Y0L1_9MYCO|nr:PPE family protein [Mycolicibacter sp. MYC340]MEB3033658.1 PPE family protein [Mycolicibacter sp. MYC340]
MEFGAVPPEVHSGLMYSGAGPGPLLAAAGAWQALAGELHTAAAAYRSVITDLTGSWHGPSALAMVAASTPYAEWISGTALQVEHAAMQVSSAAAAYEAAFAAHVPPPVIAANRSLLLTLVATNLLGQNTPAIAATDALYAEMWAQDASAMYAYAGSAATATQLTPFNPAPEATDATGESSNVADALEAAGARTASAAPSKVSQLLSAVPRTLQNLTPGAADATSPLADAGSALGDLAKFLGDLVGPYSPIGHLSNLGSGWLIAGQLVGLAQNPPGVISALNGPAPITGALGPLSGGYISYQVPLSAAGSAGATTVAASAGQASMVGSLSVPASWSTAAPAGKAMPAMLSSSSVSASASAFAVEGSSSAMFNEMALSSLAGRAVAGTAVQSVAGGATRVIDKAPDTEALTTATILVIPVPED